MSGAGGLGARGCSLLVAGCCLPRPALAAVGAHSCRRPPRANPRAPERDRALFTNNTACTACTVICACYLLRPFVRMPVSLLSAEPKCVASSLYDDFRHNFATLYIVFINRPQIGCFSLFLSLLSKSAHCVISSPVHLALLGVLG